MKKPRSHPERVAAALDAMVAAHDAELTARDLLLAQLRARNSELVEKNDRLRRSHTTLRASNDEMRRRLESLRIRFGRLAVDSTPDDEVIIPQGQGSYIAVAATLEIDHTDVRSIAAGIDPPHLHLAVIRRARTLLTNNKDAA